jgi:hypothetical protein
MATRSLFPSILKSIPISAVPLGDQSMGVIRLRVGEYSDIGRRKCHGAVPLESYVQLARISSTETVLRRWSRWLMI